MSATLREIVDDALAVIGEVAGAGVNTYSEDRMMRDAVRTFNMLFKKYYWEQYRQWFRVELDGTTGVITTDAFKFVRDFEDFYSVHVDGSQTPLPILPKKINPYGITGNTLLMWTSLSVNDAKYVNRRLQFWSKSAVGFVNVLARVYPIEYDKRWAWEDIIHLDKDMLVHGVAFMSLSADDLNSSAADTQRQLMEMKFKDITGALTDKPIPISGMGSSVPNQWFEAT